MKKYEIHVVPHTHWDREWHITFQAFRVRLVKLVNKLLHIFRTQPGYRYFVFDGQTIVLEDYLEIHPEKREELKKYVKKGRLYIGPWYILPDEFLVSGESWIRNLLIGHKIAGEFGGVMKVGYIPDPFGHISQLPQILRGFDIDSAIFTRGMGIEGERLGSEFIWQAPDGSEVIAIHQIDGYGNAGQLCCPSAWGKGEYDIEWAYKRTIALKEHQKRYTKTNCLLFNNGTDHQEPEPRLPEIIKYVNSKLPDEKLIHSNYPDYINKIRKFKKKFLKYKGELRKAKYAPLLPNVLSARMYIKQKNFSAQNLIEKYAEPLSAFAYLEGKGYPDRLLEQSWKYLLQSHPHDSICGCSIDEVHREVVQRFDWSMQICNSIIEENCDYLTKKAEENDSNVNLAVFNTLPWKRKEEITTQHGKFEVEVPACGYRVYGQAKKIVSKAGKEPVLENDYVQVKVNSNGTLKITDKGTKLVYDNLNFFEDTEDCGDEYNYSPLKNSVSFTTLNHKPEIRKTGDRLEISYDFYIPESITGDRKSREKKKVLCPLKTSVGLAGHSPVLRIMTEFDNRAEDHRLRAGFSPEIRTDYTLAEGQFDILKRTTHLNPEDWKSEIDLGAIFPQQGFVLIENNGNGLILANRGLPEYELKKGKGLYLTLLRSVGWLSRSDFMTRNGSAGPSLPTPEAQCPGANKYEYALIPFVGSWQTRLRDIYNYLVPLKTYQTSVSGEEEKSYFSLEPANLVISAIKKSERGKSIITRIFNPVKTRIIGNLKVYKKVEKAVLVKLSEEPIKRLPVSGKNIKFRIDPFQIMSIELFV
jgi:mannosylglycerate hydrolase